MRQEPDDTITLPGAEPPDGPPDAGLPGADVPAPQPDPNEELSERLGESIEAKPVGAAGGDPDHLPDVEVPTGQM